MPEIAGFSNKDTSKWTFNDYLSCVYEQDRSKVIAQIRKKLTDSKDAITQYRVRLINSSGKVVWVNLYSKKITYQNKPTLLITLNPISKDNIDHTFKQNKKKNIELNLPEEFETYFRYLRSYFSISKKKYVENVVKKEVNSRRDDLDN